MTASEDPLSPPITAETIIALNSQGLELQAQRRPAEALTLFEKIISHVPNVAEAHYNRGNALGALGRLAEAIAAYDTALALRPDLVGALNNRGWLLAQLNRYSEALDSYDRALAIVPDYTTARANRDALLKQGEYPQTPIAASVATPDSTSAVKAGEIPVSRSSAISPRARKPSEKKLPLKRKAKPSTAKKKRPNSK